MRSTMEHRLVGVWERKLETETRSSWSTQNHVARNIRLGDGFENSCYDYLAGESPSPPLSSYNYN